MTRLRVPPFAMIPWIVLGLALAPASGQLGAEQTQPPEPVPSNTEAKEDVAAGVPLYQPPIPPKVPRFKPPRRGKPIGRIGGGSRGVGTDGYPRVLTLVPAHVARTVSAQPSLFWHVDGAFAPGTRLVFTLIDDANSEPIHEVDIGVPAEAGVQRYDLSSTDVRLEVGIEYQWSISIVVDPNQRSSDIIASGWIDRVTTTIRAGATVETYAMLGLWYDALTEISNQIDARPDDPKLREQRRSLLEQVGLGDELGS